MAGLIYLLDTNTISDYINGVAPVERRFNAVIRAGERCCLCNPIYYEVSRGLYKNRAFSKLRVFRQRIVPILDWIPEQRADWRRAAKLWATLKSQGKQLSDIDIMLAAIALRPDAIIVSADNDFDALPVRRENWRQ